MGSGFVWSKRSLNNMRGVHPELVGVMTAALDLSEVDFVITEGVRTLERQRELVKAGKSWTLKSKHLIQSDGYGHAVDVAALPKDGGDMWDAVYYKKINAAVQQASKVLGVRITWGGSWEAYDTPHFQIEGV